jgi:hypothetical protein
MFVLLDASRCAVAQLGQFDKTPVNPVDEAYIFTPAGFNKPGVPAEAKGGGTARLKVRIVDDAGIAFCRVNVVGADGNFYQPKQNPLAEFSLTGAWPDRGSGNRAGKAPIRYFGRFFYTSGEFELDVPEGPARIEAWKGFEHRPAFLTVNARAGQEVPVTLRLEWLREIHDAGYHAGDPHLHFPRTSDADDQRIFDLLEAEDIHYGVVMCYNETDRYSGSMSQLVMPQLLGMGRRSQRRRGGQAIVSGQEYRNAVYGHINLFWRDDLVLPGQSYDPNNWPVFGVVGLETRQQGGYAIHAHGGYAQEIFADLVQQATNGVELLQFGIYRGIGLDGWYHILNAGYRFPAVGASDYPACRKLGDCRTYVWMTGEPTIEAWLAGLAAGHSFVTTGPLLLVDVNGKRPGERIDYSGAGPHRVWVSLRARCEVAPITHVQLLVNGKVYKELNVPREVGQGAWLELAEEPLELARSAWIAARAFSHAPSGSPDAEAHTNPVYVYVDGRAPYQEQDVDWLAGQLDAQIAQQQKRRFAEQPRVVEYFQRSRKLLDDVKRNGGQPAPAEAKP